MSNEKEVVMPSEFSCIMKKYLTNKASDRTRKYFINTPSFDGELAMVVKTMEAIRSTISSTIVTEQGDSFLVSEYNIPTKLHDYINGGIIYATADAVRCKEPIFRAPSASATMAPSTFNAFWDRYNANQINMHQVVTSPFKRETCTLEANVQYAKDGDEMTKLHEGGYSIETCYLIGFSFENKEIGKFFTNYPSPSHEYFVKWLSSSETE